VCRSRETAYAVPCQRPGVRQWPGPWSVAAALASGGGGSASGEQPSIELCQQRGAPDEPRVPRSFCREADPRPQRYGKNATSGSAGSGPGLGRTRRGHRSAAPAARRAAPARARIRTATPPQAAPPGQPASTSRSRAPGHCASICATSKPTSASARRATGRARPARRTRVGRLRPPPAKRRWCFLGSTVLATVG
jgi:hypothetical protein